MHVRPSGTAGLHELVVGAYAAFDPDRSDRLKESRQRDCLGGERRRRAERRLESRPAVGSSCLRLLSTGMIIVLAFILGGCNRRTSLGPGPPAQASDSRK